MTIGGRIREVRKLNRITQEKLAELLNVSRVTISSWENNENAPTVDNIVSLSETFRVSIDYLLRGAEPETDCEMPGRLSSPKQVDIFLDLFKSLGPVERDEVIKFMRYQKALSEGKM